MLVSAPAALYAILIPRFPAEFLMPPQFPHIPSPATPAARSLPDAQERVFAASQSDPSGFRSPTPDRQPAAPRFRSQESYAFRGFAAPWHIASPGSASA